MSAQTDARRPADRTHSRRRGGVLDGGLSRLGTDGEGNLARALSHPLSDYYLVLASSTLLVGLGVLMVLSSSSVWSSVTNQGDAYYYLVRQIAFLCVGVPSAWWLSRRNFSVLTVFGWIGMVVSILLLILVFSPLGVESFGNRAWLSMPT